MNKVLTVIMCLRVHFCIVSIICIAADIIPLIDIDIIRLFSRNLS
jgi:hypothetical protein